MNRWLVLNLKICVVTLVVLSAFVIAGCAPFDPRSDMNCLEWAVLNQQPGDRIAIGIYENSTTESHAWLVREKYCIDNMRVFDCSDSRYAENVVIDASNPESMAYLWENRKRD